MLLNISYWLEEDREGIMIGLWTRIAKNDTLAYFRARSERPHLGTEVKGVNRSQANRQPTRYWKQTLPKYKSRSCFLAVPGLKCFLPGTAWGLLWAHWRGIRFSSITSDSPVNYNITTTQNSLIFCHVTNGRPSTGHIATQLWPYRPSKIEKKCGVGIRSNRFV